MLVNRTHDSSSKFANTLLPTVNLDFREVFFINMTSIVREVPLAFVSGYFFVKLSSPFVLGYFTIDSSLS